MSRIAVISDIHGNLPALEAVIADAEGRGCDRFLNLGDCVSGPLWPAETADLLIARDWPTIAGNHERQLLGSRATMGASDGFARDRLTDRHIRWIATLPPTLVVEDTFLCHGTPDSDVTHLLHRVDFGGLHAAEDAQIKQALTGTMQSIVLCGHSHVPATRRLSNGRIAANPGSVGLQAFVDDRPFDYVVDPGNPDARYAIVEDGEVTLLALRYDHAAAARKARAEGFEHWAGWLETGQAT
ncbi:MAG: metallophosphoesterase family protein [Pseudomonadota bacterium]